MPDSDAELSRLQRVGDACLQTLPVTGVSVSVTTSGGHRVVVYASDAVAVRLEDLQTDLGVGPGLDALAQRQVMVVDDLTDRHGAAWATWPAFTGAALETPVRTLFALPLLLGAARLGVLLMYCDRVTIWTDEQQVRALALSDDAFHAVLDLLADSFSVDSVEPPAGSGPIRSTALPTDEIVPFLRSEVHQAAGMLMADLGVDIVVASVRLRGYAFAQGRSVIDVARDIIARTLCLTDDDASGPSGRGGLS